MERLALTFDDGPDPRGTPAVLDALKAAGARASFFVLGERVVEHPALLRDMVAEGMT
jgi:peptidoglycan/xylan/chitin deacetylase (PgdA/CDA1 family)